MGEKQGSKAAGATAHGGASTSRDQKYDIGKVFPRGDPKREEIMDQVNSPLFQEFWARRAHDPEHKDESRAFRKAKYGPSREEKQRYPGAISMESDSLALLVPGIWNSAIQYITFKSMVRWVLEANLNEKIERSDMVSLWDAVVYIVYYFESSATQEKKARESEEANSFTLEEYEQLVNEVREMTKDNDSLDQGHKRGHPTARDSDNENGAELGNHNKRRAPNGSAPDEESLLPTIEFSPPPPKSAPLTQAPQTKKSRAKAQPTTKPKQKSAKPELESQQEKVQMAKQSVRTPGNIALEHIKSKTADVIKGLRMMQTKRGTSGSRRGRGIYANDKPEL